MNGKTKHSEIGLELAASRARISVRAASDAAQRAHLLGLWIKSERHGDDGEWTSNRYDFSEAKNALVLGKKAVSVLQAVKSIIKPDKISSRPSARMVVLVWILDQIVLTQASASFTPAELVRGTGLQRRAAEKALNTLLADGTFVKIGEGTLTLPEGVSSEHGRCCVDGPLWTSKVTHPAFAKRKAKIVSETADVRTPDNADGLHESADGAVLETSYGQPKTAYGAFETADGAGPEAADGVLESAYGMPESAYILLETSLAAKSPEGAINLSQSARSGHHAEKSEPLSPPSVSGVPPSPQEGSEIGRIVKNKLMAWKPRDPLDIAFKTLLTAKIPEEDAVRGIETIIDQFDLENLSSPTSAQAAAVRSELLLEQVLWASGFKAAQLCDDFFWGRREPPDLADSDETASTLKMMGWGILAEPEPSRSTIATIKLAAQAYRPTIVFSVAGKILLTLFENEDREGSWANVVETLMDVLGRANEENLFATMVNATQAVDELSQASTHADTCGLSPAPGEVNNARQL
ncbi:MAG: hypothetical protein JSR78_06400 [Proteobacteria bacterium]|nr:hypothetical protein [Pseudomonadota bacterium]